MTTGERAFLVGVVVVALTISATIVTSVYLSNSHYQSMVARGCTQGSVPGVAGWVWQCPQVAR